eukprot:Platyproteum_vivax@DN3753_c0_g1_i2.p1
MERTVVMLKLKSDEGEVRATSKRVLHNKAEIRQEGCYMRSASPKCTSWNPEKPVLSQTMSIPTRRKSVNVRTDHFCHYQQDFHKGQAHDSSYSMFFGLGGLTTVEPNYEDCSITGYSGAVYSNYWRDSYCKYCREIITVNV